MGVSRITTRAMMHGRGTGRTETPLKGTITTPTLEASRGLTLLKDLEFWFNVSSSIAVLRPRRYSLVSLPDISPSRGTGAWCLTCCGQELPANLGRGILSTPRIIR